MAKHVFKVTVETDDIQPMIDAITIQDEIQSNLESLDSSDVRILSVQVEVEVVVKEEDNG